MQKMITVLLHIKTAKLKKTANNTELIPKLRDEFFIKYEMTYFYLAFLQFKLPLFSYFPCKTFGNAVYQILFFSFVFNHLPVFVVGHAIEHFFFGLYRGFSYACVSFLCKNIPFLKSYKILLHKIHSSERILKLESKRNFLVNKIACLFINMRVLSMVKVSQGNTLDLTNRDLH